MPSVASLHTDRPLTNFAVAQGPLTEWSLFEVLKPLPVAKRSDTYWIYGADWLYGVKEASGRGRFKRAPGATYEPVEYVVSEGSYTCEEYGAVGVVDDSEQANADSPLQPMEDKSLAVRIQVVGELHAQIAALLNDTGTTFASYTGAAATSWASHDTAEPVADADTARESFRSNGTYMRAANDVVMCIAVPEWYDLKRNADFIDRVKYTGRGAASLSLMQAAEYMGVDKAYIVGENENSAADGLDLSTADIWTSGNVGFYSVPKGRPGLKTPGLGFTAIWRQANGGEASTGFRMVRYRDEDINSWKVRGNLHADPEVSQAAAGYIITGA